MGRAPEQGAKRPSLCPWARVTPLPCLTSLASWLPTCLQRGLEMLNIGGMGLEGSLPACFLYNSKLYQLSAKGNNLTGDIPPVFGSTDSLQILDLSQVSEERTDTWRALLLLAVACVPMCLLCATARNRAC